MEKKVDYHKQPKVFARVSQDEKDRVTQYAKEKKVSEGWIVKRALSFFWDAVKKGQIKLMNF